MIYVYLTGGIHNRRKLISLSDQTRPTSQMIREAVFNMINVSGVVLDLFSGAGLYGLESLSRGATMCYFNDNNQKAVEAIYKNIETLKEKDRSKVFKLNYTTFLDLHQDTRFDYIFIDPPYEFSDAVISELLSKLTHYQAVIILERHKQSKSPEIEGLKIIKEKTYGIKKITIYQ